MEIFTLGAVPKSNVQNLHFGEGARKADGNA